VTTQLQLIIIIIIVIIIIIIIIKSGEMHEKHAAVTRKLLEDRGELTRDCQCTYDVTMRRFRATIVVVEKQKVLHIVCICSLRYAVSSAHASYFHLWRL